jgi:putative SOS response-associated peptidase YedK
MCGRYIANSEDEIMEIREILKQISLRLAAGAGDPVCADNPAVTALSEIFPTHEVLFINKAYELTRAKFGLEKWDKKGVIINAKSETYEQSRFFRPFAANRCIIPAHGYFEWGKSLAAQDKSKTKFMFATGAKHGIFMAGIYDKDSRFVVITKPAERDIAHIHPRMPLIVGTEQAEDWLCGKLNVQWLAEQSSGIIFREAG